MKRKIMALVISICLSVLCVTGCDEQPAPDSVALSEATQTSPTSASVSETTSQSTTVTTPSQSETQTSSQTSQTTQSETETESESETETESSSQTMTTTVSTSATQTKAQPKTTTKAVTTASTKAQTSASTKASSSAGKRITGTSPNVSFYQDRLVIAGDSVANGYLLWGYIPYEHNIAAKNVSITGYQKFTFDPTGVPLGMIDAIKAVNPSLLLTSMGMNDCLMTTSFYESRYREFLKKVRAVSPDSVIMLGAVTPTAVKNNYPHVKIEVVRSFNAALKRIADSMDDKVIYFDAFSVVVADDGVHLQDKYAIFDGLHLQNIAYRELVNAMAVTLDKYGMKEKILALEAARKK